MILPIATRGVQSVPCMPYANITLQAGDTIQVCSSAAATRAVGYSVITSAGVHSIFSGLDSTGNIELLHVLSGQGIGASLTGQTIVRHFGTQSSASNLKNTSGGVYVLNDRGLPAGSCGLTVLSNLQPTPNAMAGATVGLNFVARVTTSA